MEIKWWKNAVGYQIYPRSFYDSNNDGMGDLPGIIEKLDYIKELGADLIWIGPFYCSPMDDNGYDVSDFYDVDPMFGTMDDAVRLIKTAHEKGIKIILDLVLNHTSDMHPWFIESRKSIDNEKRDWYIWRKGKIDVAGNRIPPTNWASFFEGSCWNYDEISGEYYLKIFSDKMPDLNWTNPQLREAMFDMAKWWLDLGVDGFRVDAIAHLAKDETFTDSTLKQNHDGVVQDWTKFSNRPKLLDYLHEFHDKVLSHYDVVSIGEVGGGADVKDALKYAGYHSKAFNMVFNFDHCWKNDAFGAEDKDESEIKTNVISLKNTFDHWIQGMNGNGWIPHYWLNHDHPRVLSQYGDVNFHRESGSMLGMVLLTLPGTPFIYNGEEIGMTNVDYTSIDEFNDVWVKNYYAKAILRQSPQRILDHLRRTSRDNARTPMQWNNTINAGFTKGTPFQKPVGNYTWINVEKQQSEPDSILSSYRKLIQLRKDSSYHHVLVYGEFRLIAKLNPDVIAFERKDKQHCLVSISNFRSEEVKIRLPYSVTNVIFNNYPNVIISREITLKPFQALLLERKF